MQLLSRKDKKKKENKISEIEYYNCYKKSHYTIKCFDK